MVKTDQCADLYFSFIMLLHCLLVASIAVSMLHFPFGGVHNS